MIIKPSRFGLDLNDRLKNLNKKKQLNPDEEEEKERLEQLKKLLPNDEEPQDGLQNEERALLINYLAMRLFENPLTQDQEEEFQDLLARDKKHEWGL